MSFIHKIINKATRYSSSEEKPQRRSFFGFGTTKDEKPKTEEESLSDESIQTKVDANTVAGIYH
jgi:hypothetical protein